MERPSDIESQRETLRERCVVEIYDPEKISWEEIGADIMRIEQSASGDEEGLDEETLQELFENKESIIILMRDPTEQDKIVGFTAAEPTMTAYADRKEYSDREQKENTAYISDSAFERDYQGHGLIAPLMETLEKRLVKGGYLFMERDAADVGEPGKTYSDKIRKNYEGRITEEKPHDSEYGKQVFFRIKLKKLEIKN
jgi:GNAT superfamily N-acetyltransferase